MQVIRLHTLLVSVIGIMAITSGCDLGEEESFLSIKEKAFFEIVQVENINKSLKLEPFLHYEENMVIIDLPPGKENPNQNDDYIDTETWIKSTIELTNLSNKDICFVNENVIRLFYFETEENDWMEIINKKTNYTNDPKNILPYEGNGLNWDYFSISPELPKLLSDEPIAVRVLAQGTFCGTNISVAGFADMDYLP